MGHGLLYIGLATSSDFLGPSLKYYFDAFPPDTQCDNISFFIRYALSQRKINLGTPNNYSHRGAAEQPGEIEKHRPSLF